MKYIIKYYQNINYLKSIERYRFYKLYSVTTDWEGTKKMTSWRDFWIGTFFASPCWQVWS